MTTRGFIRYLCLTTRLMKLAISFSEISKSAITPSFRGRIAAMPPGVRPVISLAAAPTASTLPVDFSTATTDGSFRTIP